MNKQQARFLAKTQNFSQKDLTEILIKAGENYAPEQWKKPCPVNTSFSYGHFYNHAADYLKQFEEDKIINMLPGGMILTKNILRAFGEFYKEQPKKKTKPTEECHHEEPKLIKKPS